MFFSDYLRDGYFIIMFIAIVISSAYLFRKKIDKAQRVLTYTMGIGLVIVFVIIVKTVIMMLNSI